MIDKQTDYDFVEHIEIILGKIQALKVKMYKRNVVFINVYGPNADDKTFFELLCNFLEENEENEFIIGGDFNTVLEPKLDKMGGNPNTHIKSRETIQTAIENFDLNDIWRVFNGNNIQFTWHSSSKPYIFSRLDYFLVSNSLVNTVCDCTIIPGFKSDHSIVTISMQFTNEQRGPGYFKINNSILLQSEYQKQIKKTINETVTNNVDANPNVLWKSNKRFYKKHNNSICFKDEKRKPRARNKTH